MYLLVGVQLQACGASLQAAMRSSSVDGVQVYTLCGPKQVPRWVLEAKEGVASKKAQRKRRNDGDGPDEASRSIELVQDLGFPASCNRIKKSADGAFLLASGTHAPQVRAYELNQLSMKFSRHLDAEVVDFQVLSEDYAKLAILCHDRSVCFHAKFGAYYKTRVPRHGRDLAYAERTCDLLVASSSPELYRLNLEQGRFLAPLASISPAVNACGISPMHGMLACAGEDGVLECFDLRERKSIGSLDVGTTANAGGMGLTSVRFDQTGLQMATGTSDGKVLVYDLRSSRPMIIKDHKYGNPIVDLKFHDSGGSSSSRRYVISSDKFAVRIWDKDTGKPFTTIESQVADLNDVCVWDGKGLILMATEAPQVQSYFIPALGPAPSWCSFLEGLTEELEEDTTPTVYDDFKFVTKEELDRLGLNHLVGTSMLRAYMHGFFMDVRLYHKAKSVADPFAYDSYRQERIKQKMEEERKTRIRVRRKLPKVNAEVAAKLLADAEQDNSKADKPGLLGDERFAKMFEDRDFAIDENAEDYKLLHPNAANKKDRKQLVNEHFDLIEEGGPGVEDVDHDTDTDDGRQQGPGGAREPKMFEAKDERAAAAFRERKSLASIRALPLGQLAEALSANKTGQQHRTGFKGGNKELSFVPRTSAAKPKGKRRGMKLPGEVLPAGGGTPGTKRKAKQ